MLKLKENQTKMNDPLVISSVFYPDPLHSSTTKKTHGSITLSKLIQFLGINSKNVENGEIICPCLIMRIHG